MTILTLIYEQKSICVQLFSIFPIKLVNGTIHVSEDTKLRRYKMPILLVRLVCCIAELLLYAVVPGVEAL